MFDVAQDQAFPKIQQLSFFLPNRVGSMQRVITVLEEAQIRICGISILDAHDHAVVRMIVDKPEKAMTTLGSGGRAICTTELLAVAMPDENDAVTALFGRMLRAELNVYYAYALLRRHNGQAIIAVHTDDIGGAADVLRKGGFELVEQRDLDREGG